MDYSSSLGPIDPQVTIKDNGIDKLVPALGVLFGQLTVTEVIVTGGGVGEGDCGPPPPQPATVPKRKMKQTSKPFEISHFFFINTSP